MVPDLTLADLYPARADLLVVAGAVMWDRGDGRAGLGGDRGGLPRGRCARGRHLWGHRRARPGRAARRSASHQRRARLLACTEAGYWAIRQISVAHHPWADRVASRVDLADLRHALDTLCRLTTVLDEDRTASA